MHTVALYYNEASKGSQEKVVVVYTRSCPACQNMLSIVNRVNVTAQCNENETVYAKLLMY